MTPVLAPPRLPTEQSASRNPPSAILSSANTCMQMISSTKPGCETRKHSPSERRRPVTCSNRTGERRGGALAGPMRRCQPHAQQGSELRKYGEVELSGLEPLTSCMPYKLRPSPHVAGRGPAWRSPAASVAARGLASPGVAPRWLPTWLPELVSAANIRRSGRLATRRADRHRCNTANGTLRLYCQPCVRMRGAGSVGE